jgi:hypothetical protein
VGLREVVVGVGAGRGCMVAVKVAVVVKHESSHDEISAAYLRRRVSENAR